MGDVVYLDTWKIKKNLREIGKFIDISESFTVTEPAPIRWTPITLDFFSPQGCDTEEHW